MGAHRQLWAGEDGKKVSVVGPRALVFSCFLCSSHPLTSFIFIIQRFFKQYFIRKEFKIIFVCFYHLPILL